MKNILLSTLMTTLAVACTACGDLQLPLGPENPTPAGPSAPTKPTTPTTPPVTRPTFDNPDCVAAFPSTATCVNAAGKAAFERTPRTIAIEKAAVRYINEKRAENYGCSDADRGKDNPPLPALGDESHVQFAAQKHSEYISYHLVTSEYSGVHGESITTSPKFYDPMHNKRLAKAGVPIYDPISNPATRAYRYELYAPAENIASWYFGNDSPEKIARDVIGGQMASTGHCQAILVAAPGYVGVGVAENTAPDGRTLTSITINFAYNWIWN